MSTLYWYELKKILNRKLVWVMLLLCLSAAVITVTSDLFGKYYVDGTVVDTHYHMYQVDRGYREKLSGRPIDNRLLTEMVDAYRKIPLDEPRYTLTEEYQTYARPYSDIYGIVRIWSGMDLESILRWDADETSLYEKREANLEQDWRTVHLSETEKAFWREKESQIKKPVVYSYHEGYSITFNAFLTIGIMTLLFMAVCLSGVFSEEHTRRTDQLILSSAKGKNAAYWAKIFAGMTVSVVFAVLMTLTTIVLSLGIYGTDGFNAALQIEFMTYSYPLTIGQACLILYGILIVTSVLFGLFVMVLSEFFHSGTVTMAISTVLIIAGQMIEIPEQFRIVSQIWDSLPMKFLSIWDVYNTRPITVWGHCFVSWQFVPVVYLLSCFAIAVIGKSLFQNYQVSGR